MWEEFTWLHKCSWTSEGAALHLPMCLFNSWAAGEKELLINTRKYWFPTAQEAHEKTGGRTVLTRTPMQNVPATVLSLELQGM